MISRKLKKENPVAAFELCFKRGDQSECWEWLTGKSSRGYGTYNIENKSLKAHRYSYELYVGKIPSGLVVCHKCDNPSCVNPNHLFIGTQKDNVQDSVLKGRALRSPGEQNGNSKLTDEIVKKARNLYATGNFYQSEIGRLFGVDSATIRSAIIGETWKHL